MSMKKINNICKILMWFNVCFDVLLIYGYSILRKMFCLWNIYVMESSFFND